MRCVLFLLFMRLASDAWHLFLQPVRGVSNVWCSTLAICGRGIWYVALLSAVCERSILCMAFYSCNLWERYPMRGISSCSLIEGYPMCGVLLLQSAREVLDVWHCFPWFARGVSNMWHSAYIVCARDIQNTALFLFVFKFVVSIASELSDVCQSLCLL